MSKRTPEEKKRRTARNKTRRIEREMRKHPELANNAPMLAWLEQLKKLAA